MRKDYPQRQMQTGRGSDQTAVFDESGIIVECSSLSPSGPLGKHNYVKNALKEFLQNWNKSRHQVESNFDVEGHQPSYTQ